MDQNQTVKDKPVGKNGNGGKETQTKENETNKKDKRGLCVNEGHNRPGYVCGIPC